MQNFPYDYHIDQPRRGFRYMFKLFAVLVFVLAIVLGIYYFTKVNSAATDESREIRFTVAKGSTTRMIATQLQDKKVIGNKYIFIVYIKLHDAGNKIQAGEYLLNSNMTTAKVVEVLTLGKVSLTQSSKVTLIEGKTNDQVATELEKKNILAAADFLHAITDDSYDFIFKDVALKFNYQGFIFPDTYEFAKDATSLDILQKILSNFETKITDQMIEDMTSKNLKLADVITLASIIEKEVGRNKETISEQDIETMQRERELVASVFYNRLEVGMALESDATVNYVTGKSDRSVTIEDTKIESPYNTYANRGLPPGPISNPGIDSIMAAIYPANSDYVYFLNSPDGTAYYAKTLAEHGENRAKYLR